MTTTKDSDDQGFGSMVRRSVLEAAFTTLVIFVLVFSLSSIAGILTS